MNTLAKAPICLLLILCGTIYLNVTRSAPQQRQLQAPDDDDPILVLGLPRAGSIAIHNFFQCNGFRSAHYCCGNSPKSSFSCGKHPTCGDCVLTNLKASNPPFYKCGDYKVFSQFDVEVGEPFEWFLPQHFALSLLHNSHPRSTFILNRRASAHVWADSVLHWYTKTQRLMNSFGMDYHLNSPPLMVPERNLIQEEVEKCLQDSYALANSTEEHLRRRNDLVLAYERHLQKVREFVESHPSHKLIEIDVDDPDAATILVDAFHGFRTKCWNFDANSYDGDWKDFTLRV